MATRRSFLALLGLGVVAGNIPPAEPPPVLPRPDPWRVALFPGRYAHDGLRYFDRICVASAEPIEGELVGRDCRLRQYRDGAWRAFSFGKSAP